jgi:DNA-binding SARP family transcriptional activator
MRVGLLGPIEVGEADHPLHIASAKQRALVALLALDAGRVVSVERLIEGLWGDKAPADAGNALRHHVSRLRKTIGPSLVTQRSGYLLAVERDEVDALHFARLAGEARAGLPDRPPGTVAATLRSALALWRGAPLEEFLDHDWARREASRLTELHLAAVEDRFDVDLSMGLHADVVEEIRGMVGAHPFRERLWGQLMLALYRSGRQTEALAAYADARKVLAEEPGLDPGPDLTALERAILAHDPDLAAPPTQVLDTRRLPAADMPAPLTSFVGRHEQLAAIRSLLNESRLITLTGPPGVGKTRLAVEVGRLVQQEFPDGAWLVELAPLTDLQGIADALVALLGLRAAGRVADSVVEEPMRTPPVGPLIDQLRGRRVLLILDNCEHLVARVAALVEPLLAGCPELHVLATSREALGVPGEAQWPVPSLTLPGPTVDDPRELVGSEAVRLFEDRARKVRPSFALTAETASVRLSCSTCSAGWPTSRCWSPRSASTGAPATACWRRCARTASSGRPRTEPTTWCAAGTRSCSPRSPRPVNGGSAAPTTTAGSASSTRSWRTCGRPCTPRSPVTMPVPRSGWPARSGSSSPIPTGMPRV